MNISSEARILLTWFSVVSLWLVWNARLVYSIAWLCINMYGLASFPGLPRLQFLIACSTRQGRPGREISMYHEETSVPAYQKLGWKNLGTRVLYNPNFITSETRTPQQHSGDVWETFDTCRTCDWWDTPSFPLLLACLKVRIMATTGNLVYLTTQAWK